MSRNNGHRTRPFQGFSRGVPIIGAKPQALPKGRHFYHVPALIQWPGRPLECDGFEAWFPMPINGVYFQGLQAEIVGKLTKEGEEPPKVVLLAPVFLGFVPQEEIDKQEAARAAAAADEGPVQ